MSQQSRRFCFTLNNFTEEELKQLERVGESAVVKYAIFAREIGESGTPHLQGYVETTKRFTYKGLLTALKCARLSLRIAKGTAAENLAYISKENPPFVFGTPMSQGTRTDLNSLRQDIIDGKSMLEIADTDFNAYCRYRKSFECYKQLVQERTEFPPPQVYVLFGKPGTGKTRYVHDNHEDIWSWPGKEWFDGYDNNEVALFDDFDGSDFAYRLLLRVLDRYPIRVPTKGGHVPWRPSIIYLTSNLRPEQWYRLEDNSALMRRITEIKSFE